MADDEQSYDPPQDTGAPDSVESDPAALNSAEDLDEDRLRMDPLEEGMDPPEHWSGVDKYGMTEWEQAHSAPLDQRLAEEEPDTSVTGESAAGEVVSNPDELPDVPSYGEKLGIAADFAGGSMPEEIRTPRSAE